MFDLATVYALLPGWIRLRDQQQGGPLNDFLSVVVSQVALLEEDLAQSYDNLFIETAAPWVVPYIGDLVQSTPLMDTSRIADTGTVESLVADLTGPSFQPHVGLRSRADVARTIYYRRRKTTLPVLEQLSADVTGWAAHVREFFMTLAWTQAVRNHIRSTSFGAPDLRSVPNIDRIDGPFDTLPRTVDVRRPAQLEGWHNIPNVGIFLYRLNSTPLYQTTARPVVASGGYGFAVSPLGQTAPMFTRWRQSIDATLPSAEPLLPGPIRPAAFFDDLQSYQAGGTNAGFTQYYGVFGFGAPSPSALPNAAGASFYIVADGKEVAPEQLQTMNLAAWRQPPAAVVGVDVERGLLSFGSNWAAAGQKGPNHVGLTWFRGFPADVGGGGYDRQNWLSKRAEPGLVVLTVGGANGLFPTISAALAAVPAGTVNLLISVQDSATYVENIVIQAVDKGRVTIEAVDRHWPHIEGSITIEGSAPSGAVCLSGLLVEGAVTVESSLGALRLAHATLVPGLAIDGAIPSPTPPSVIVKSTTAELNCEIIFSVCGPLRIPTVDGSRLWVLDSIVDGAGSPGITGASGIADPAPQAWIERSTLVGPSHFWQILSATEALFTGKVTTDHRQQGCVRFSFVPDQSSTPRRYRCQPDLEIAAEIARATPMGGTLSAEQVQAIHDSVVLWLLPEFTEHSYGQPAYLQLHLHCPWQLRKGAEDGSEMGAYCHLKQPQRLKNLQIRLQEYLPFSREAAIIFVT
jgi:hypothetical protein